MASVPASRRPYKNRPRSAASGKDPDQKVEVCRSPRAKPSARRERQAAVVGVPDTGR